MPALRLLLTNDDGVTSPALRRLHVALRAAGHEVVVSAPARDHSGASGSFRYFERHAVERLGDEEWWSVDGPPVVAALHGIDLLGRERPFDLVISGPNVGWNLGHFTLYSGTVGAALVALRRGLPALAVSADHDETDFDAVAAEVAALIAALVASRHDPLRLLPMGLGINVNIPLSSHLRGLAFTRIGDWSPFHLGFVERMDQHAHPRWPLPAEPGIALLDAERQPDAFSGQETEGRVILSGLMTISPLHTGALSEEEALGVIRTRLSGFAVTRASDQS